jgi:bifunctional DNA-binding transcriptional regulator/antitoxin component of YhaV-PrlF toxin-antitoxin module
MGNLIEVVSVSQNRITVPKKVRETLKLSDKSKVAWRVEKGKFYIEKVE